MVKRGTFTFQGKSYEYFYHKYNTTWQNERAVEIPIVSEVLKKSKTKNILEVGNVLSYYFPVTYDIVDKYERAKGVINEDIVDFHPSKKYDLIISISTLEHVGWIEDLDNDKIQHTSFKICKTIENMKRLLSPQGRIFITVPLGWNCELDELISNETIRFTKRLFMKRVSKDNKWVEVDYKNVKGAKYGSPFPSANALLVGIIDKTSDDEV
jgi:SAM-dependent methyltransferase